MILNERSYSDPSDPRVIAYNSLSKLYRMINDASISFDKGDYKDCADIMKSFDSVFKKEYNKVIDFCYKGKI